jgi:hypothetical protein
MYSMPTAFSQLLMMALCVVWWKEMFCAPSPNLSIIAPARANENPRPPQTKNSMKHVWMYLLSRELNIYPYLPCFKDTAIGQEISYITCPSTDVFPPELRTENSNYKLPR